MARPVDSLGSPDGSDPVPDSVENALSFSLLSPSYYVQQFCNSVFGQNIWDYCADQISGDWDGVKRAGSATKNLASYNDEFADSIRTGVKSIDSSWRGNAAESAKSYFDDLAESISNQSPALNDIGDKMHHAAFAMYELSKAISDALGVITDMAIIAIAEFAAGAALEASVVGTPGAALAFAAGTLQVTLMLREWGVVTGKISTAWNAVEALASGMVITATGAEFAELPTLPTATYDHPGA